METVDIQHWRDAAVKLRDEAIAAESAAAIVRAKFLHACRRPGASSTAELLDELQVAAAKESEALHRYLAFLNRDVDDPIRRR